MFLENLYYSINRTFECNPLLYFYLIVKFKSSILDERLMIDLDFFIQVKNLKICIFRKVFDRTVETQSRSLFSYYLKVLNIVI